MGKQRVAAAMTPHQGGQTTVLTMSLWYPAAPRPPVERQGLFLCQSAKVGLSAKVWLAGTFNVPVGQHDR